MSWLLRCIDAMNIHTIVTSLEQSFRTLELTGQSHPIQFQSASKSIEYVVLVGDSSFGLLSFCRAAQNR